MGTNRQGEGQCKCQRRHSQNVFCPKDKGEKALAEWQAGYDYGYQFGGFDELGWDTPDNREERKSPFYRAGLCVGEQQSDWDAEEARYRWMYPEY